MRDEGEQEMKAQSFGKYKSLLLSLLGLQQIEEVNCLESGAALPHVLGRAEEVEVNKEDGIL